MLTCGANLQWTVRELDLCYATLRIYKLKGLPPSVDEASQASAGVEPETAQPEVDAETVPSEALGRE